MCSFANNSHNDIHEKVMIHEKVKALAKYNCIGCKIPVYNRINTAFIKAMLHDYTDKSVCEWLNYGFPIGAVEYMYNDTLDTMLPV